MIYADYDRGPLALKLNGFARFVKSAFSKSALNLALNLSNNESNRRHGSSFAYFAKFKILSNK